MSFQFLKNLDASLGWVFGVQPRLSREPGPRSPNLRELFPLTHHQPPELFSEAAVMFLKFRILWIWGTVLQTVYASFSQGPGSHCPGRSHRTHHSVALPPQFASSQAFQMQLFSQPPPPSLALRPSPTGPRGLSSERFPFLGLQYWTTRPKWGL